jgi:lipid II:glycine glycyltransferase (peptidoglycan interpeptide bridge formation enzyme)
MTTARTRRDAGAQRTAGPRSATRRRGTSRAAEPEPGARDVAPTDAPAGPPPDATALCTDDTAWDAFVAASPAGSHLQLTAWAGVKRANGWRPVRVVADGGSGPIGAQVLVRRLGLGPVSVGYAARGPIATTWDEVSIAAFTAQLRRLARRLRLSHVTLDPGVEDPAIRPLVLGASWRPADPVQHDRTRIIELAHPESALWSDVRATSRRWVNRARREGCTVEEGGPADLDAFFDIMVETARRSGFIHRARSAYAAVLEAFGPTGGASLLLARLPDGTPAAAKLLVRCGGRVTQPYSGMTAAGAETGANHLLEWETIRRAATAGATRYDLWGLASPGIARFKAGFGGREVDYVGTFDVVGLPLVRDAVVLARRGYVRLARRRHGLGPREVA